MLRWLKGGKRKKSTKAETEKDVYGFSNQVDNPQRSNPEFVRSKSAENLDSSVHIYHEINDIPEISFSRQYTLLPDGTHSQKNPEGPYLVVPLLPVRNELASSENQNHTHPTVMPLTKEENRRKAYNEPWDKTKMPKDASHSDSHPAFRDTNSIYTCSTASIRSDSDIIQDSDTGCEYDMSTSTDSDVSSEYKVLINKMQNNLQLKHQILQMIKESENSDSEQNSEQKHLKKLSFMSLDSCDLQRANDIFDKEETESEYSSGFDECEIHETDNPSPFTSTQKENKQKFSVSSCYDQPKKLHSNRLEELYVPTKRYQSVKSSHSGTKLNSRNYVAAQQKPKPLSAYNKHSRYSNRLLGDIISMNHNMQTLKF